MSKVKKAVIPAAGLGTRFLPATKAQPKEMLPIVDKPTIQYVVEEAVASGIEDILIITGRNKRAIEDHFDHCVEVELSLEKKQKEAELQMIREISELADIHYVRQKEPLGLGHAIYCARKFVQEEPFAVLLGDDIINSEVPCTRQLIEVFEARGGSVLGVQEVAWTDVHKYGIVSSRDRDKDGDRSGDGDGNGVVDGGGEGAGAGEGAWSAARVSPGAGAGVGAEAGSELVCRVASLVEKPTREQAPSRLATLGRYVIEPEIFAILERTGPGTGGEIQLTDALNELAKSRPVWAYTFSGKRYDVGDKLGFLEATVEYALRREDLAADFAAYLRRLLETDPRLR